MSITLTPGQQARVTYARALAAIDAGNDAALAAHLGHNDLSTVYPVAYADARQTIISLLSVVSDLTGGAS